MFYLVGVFRTASLGDSTSSNSERTALRMWGEEPGYVEVLQQRAGSLNIKRLLLKKTRYSKLSLELYSAWENASVWAHWNHSFTASQLPWASILLFPPECPWGVACRPDDCQTFYSLLGVLRVQELMLRQVLSLCDLRGGSLPSLCPWNFPGKNRSSRWRADDCDVLVYRFSRKHSIFH